MTPLNDRFVEGLMHAAARATGHTPRSRVCPGCGKRRQTRTLPAGATVCTPCMTAAARLTRRKRKNTEAWRAAHPVAKSIFGE